MSKLLTISIAAYNVSEYIETTLQSLVTSKYIDLLEIIVVNDGSKDNTLEIIEKYEMDYPGSVIVIDKENGGYGTTVNASIEKATGKFFRLLDGDDWVDTNELDKLLLRLLETDVDVVFTNFSKVYEDSKAKKTVFIDNLPYDTRITLSSCHDVYGVGMWAISYNLELLKQINLQLPSGIPYTDMLFSTLPMFQVTEAIYYDLNVYQYRIGREGQSISRESRIKNADTFINLTKDLVVAYSQHELKNDYVKNRILGYTFGSYKTLLLNLQSDEVKSSLQSFDMFIYRYAKEIYDEMEHKRHSKVALLVKLVRLSRYRLIDVLAFFNYQIKNWE
ncbi:glycosyltransferase [Streptococcus fryi]